MPTTLLSLEEVVRCTVLRRRNRFVVEVEADGAHKLAWVNNTGRLREFMAPGRTAFCLPRPPSGKTQLRLFAFHDGQWQALIDTLLQMRAFERCLERGLLPWLPEPLSWRRNPRVGASLLDYRIEYPDGPVHAEVKSAVYRQGLWATYPDCPSLRGRRHIHELIRLAQDGDRAVLIFVAALGQVAGFRASEEGDPEIAALLPKAAAAGVEIHALQLGFDSGSGDIVLLRPEFPVHADSHTP